MSWFTHTQIRLGAFIAWLQVYCRRSDIAELIQENELLRDERAADQAELIRREQRIEALQEDLRSLQEELRHQTETAKEAQDLAANKSALVARLQVEADAAQHNTAAALVAALQRCGLADRVRSLLMTPEALAEFRKRDGT